MSAQGQVLPTELRLTAPPTMPQARSYLFKQKSSLSSYSERQVIQINIPRLQRSYIQKGSYLNFTVKLDVVPGNVPTTAPTTGPWFPALKVCLDTPGAFGLIDKIEIYDYLGSTLLESTSGFGALMALMMDGKGSGELSGQAYNTSAGTGKQLVGNMLDMAQYKYSNTQNTLVPFGPISGTPFLFTQVPDATTKYSAQTLTREFSIPLFSFLGMLGPKLVPLHNGFTINITLASQNNAFGVTTITGASVETGSLTSFKVTDVYYCAQILELGPQAESMLLSSTQGNPMVVHTKAYRNYVSNIEPNSNTFRLDLNLNVASMTALFWIMRPTKFVTLAGSTGAPGRRSLSARIRNFLQNWYFQYGSSILPQTTGIQAIAPGAFSYANTAQAHTQCFSELLKAFGVYNDWDKSTTFTDANYRQDLWVDNVNDLLTPDAANTPTSGTIPISGTALPYAGADTPRFACGLDLKLSPEHDTSMISGLNTNGMNTSINATFASDKLASQVQVQVDAWAEYDAFINISPGLATTVSF